MLKLMAHGAHDADTVHTFTFLARSGRNDNNKHAFFKSLEFKCAQQHSAHKFIANFTSAIGFRFIYFCVKGTECALLTTPPPPPPPPHALLYWHISLFCTRMHTASFVAEFLHSSAATVRRPCVCDNWQLATRWNMQMCALAPRMLFSCGFINIVYIRNFQIFITFAFRAYTRWVHFSQANGD